MASERNNAVDELQRVVNELYAGRPPRNVVANFIREKRRAVLFEAVAEGLDPACYFGEHFLELCAEAGIRPEDLRLIR